jgi:hypothetical protein
VALPDSLTLITLTGDMRTGEGEARAGTVTIRLPTPIRSQGDNVIIPPFEVVAELVDGAFSAELPATTDPGWAPNSAEYVVQATFSDYSKLWWSFPLPHNTAGAALDLADVGAPAIGTPTSTAVAQPVADGGYKGTWDDGTLYRTGDTVQHSTSLYGALRPSTAVTPGTDATTWKIYPSSGGGGGAVDSVFGRTGDIEAESGDYTKAQVGLGNVDNTSDATKPVSAAQQAALDLKAPLASPAFSGTVTGVSKAMVGLGNADNTSDLNKPVSTAALAALDLKADLVGGVIPSAQIPAIALTEYLGEAASQAAMLGLSGQSGDWAIRTDLGTTWIITGDDPGELASWTELAYPAAQVTSVNGQAGAVTLTAANVGAAEDDHTHGAAGIVSGTLDIARIPTGTSGSTVALGNDVRLSDTRTPTDGSVSTAKIVDGNVSLAKLAAIAAATILGNNTVGAGAPAALTASQVKTLLAIAQSDVSGLTAALALLAPLASPALTGTATAVNVTVSGRQLNTPVALTSGASVAVNAALGNQFALTAAHTFTLANPTNPVNGQMIMFAIRQDGTGSRVLTLGSDYRLGTDITEVVLSTAAGKTDYLGVRYNGTDSKWDVIAFVTGY